MSEPNSGLMLNKWSPAEAKSLISLLDLVEAEPTAEDAKVCWRDFWQYCRYVRTEDIDDFGRIRFFPIDFDFLHEFMRRVESDKPVFCYEKSRRLMISNTLVSWCDWNMGRTFTDVTGDLWSACWIIKNEDDAKKIIRRGRDILVRLPTALQRPLSIDNVLQLQIKGGGFMEGLNAGGQGPRQEGYTVGILDELAYQLHAPENYRALRQCAHKVIGGSSANGTGNVHHDMISGKIPGVDVMRIHYSDHPHRKPGTPEGDAWRKRAQMGVPKNDWDREQEIKYDVYAEPGWYTADFSEDCAQAVQWDKKAIITISFDPGFVRAGCVISYVNEHSQWCRIKEFLGREETTENFAGRVFEYAKGAFPEAQYRLTADPAAAQRKSLRDTDGTNTDLDVLNRVAASVLMQPVFVQCDRIPALHRRDGHRMVRRQFLARPDGRRGTLIDPQGCPILVAAFRGGYRQIENATPHQIELEEPNRTSDHVHLCDADRYAVMQFTLAPAIAEYENVHRKQVPVLTPIFDEDTGYIRGYQ